MINRHKVTLFPVLWGLLVCAGCALSPQTIDVIPSLSPVSGMTQSRQTLTIAVTDNRADPVMGYRGGVYDTAAVSTADGMAANIGSEVARIMRGAGFEVVPGGGQADLLMQIDVNKLAYAAVQNNLLWNIEINVTMSASVTHDGASKSVEIQDRVTRDYARAPTEKDNAALVNDVINKVLQRIVENRTLFDR